MIKKTIFVLITLVLVFQLIPSFAASPDLDVEKERIRRTIIPGVEDTAVYNLTITNNGMTDRFRIYSTAGVKVLPETKYKIEKGETKTIPVELLPNSAIVEDKNSYNFVYKIKGEKTGSKKDSIKIKIKELKEAVNVIPSNITIGDEETDIVVENLADYNFENVSLIFDSAFFHSEKEISLNEEEKEEFSIPIEDKGLIAEEYELETAIEFEGVREKSHKTFHFEEDSEIVTSEKKKGFLIRTHEINNTNKGNSPDAITQATIEKNIISRLFTHFNQDPSSSERKGLKIIYNFKDELDPDESYSVRATTNWTYPLLFLALIITIVWLLNLYYHRDLDLRKETNYVKTKSGKFALRVKVVAKAKNFVENIKLVDKIPNMVKVHKKFGTYEPDNIDEKNRRLEWNIESLQEGEERVFSYIVYSDISPVGKFELPTATAIYERDGKIEENESNKVFFMTEEKIKEKEDK